MNNSDAEFRVKFIKLINEQKRMASEQLTNDEEFDNIVELGDATE